MVDRLLLVRGGGPLGAGVRGDCGVLRLPDLGAFSHHPQQHQRGVVIPHFPLVAQMGNFLLPLPFGHVPVAVPIGRIARLHPPQGPTGDRVGAQHQQVAGIAELVELLKLQELIPAEIDASEHQRVGFKLGRAVDREPSQRHSVADVEQAAIADRSAS